MDMKHVKTLFVVGTGALLLAAPFVNGGARLPNKHQVQQFETRCGWLSNPTPANVWLYDGKGEWIIGLQGGYQAKGDWGPEFNPRQWVPTNVGSYGYGCACLRLRVNQATREVLEIKSSWGRPLAVCRRDSSLKKWRQMFK